MIAEAPNIELVEGEDGELLISIPISTAPKKLPQYYGFTTGRHSGSFFLKIGAAVFCVIHIIHLFLIIVKEVMVDKLKLFEAKKSLDSVSKL